jgi:hypothetical protein
MIKKCHDCDYEGYFDTELNSNSMYYGAEYCPKCGYCPAVIAVNKSKQPHLYK